jgi:hypothetical protein
VQHVRNRLTYANVVASLALFLAVAGGSAFAASQLGKNSVGAKQLKANAVTAGKIKKNAVTTAKIKNNAISAAKIKNGAITGAKVNLTTLGTVPSAQNAVSASNAQTAKSAQTANSANSVAGRIPISVFTPAGKVTLATVGPFTITAECRINDGGQDEGETFLSTSVDGASMDDNNGAEYEVFNVADSPADLWSNSTSTGEPDIEVASDPGLTAVAPDGTAIIFGNETIGFNIAGKPGQCYFGGMVQKIG